MEKLSYETLDNMITELGFENEQVIEYAIALEKQEKGE